MKKLVNILLYLSAFLPMLFVMWIKEVIIVITDSVNSSKEAALAAAQATKTAVTPKFDWSCLLNIYLLSELTAIVIISISLLILMKSNKKAATKMVKVKNLKNQVAEYYLAYFSLFVLALIGFSLTNLADVVSLCLLMVVLGIVYIRNGMFYMNPTINLLQSFIYEIEYQENEKSFSRIVISKKKLHIGETFNIYQSKYDFTLVKGKPESEVAVDA